MRKTKISLLALAAMVVMPGLSVSPAATASQANCRKPSETLLQRSSQIVVVATSRGARTAGGIAVYACRRSTGKRVRLDRRDGGPHVFEPAGRFVLFALFVDVTLVNVARGAFYLVDRHSYTGGPGQVLAGVVKPNGSVAVLTENSGFNDLRVCEIESCYSENRREIDEDSLRLDGSTLTWVRDGVPQQATLK